MEIAAENVSWEIKGLQEKGITTGYDGHYLNTGNEYLKYFTGIMYFYSMYLFRRFYFSISIAYYIPLNLHFCVEDGHIKEIHYLSYQNLKS